MINIHYKEILDIGVDGIVVLKKCQNKSSKSFLKLYCCSGMFNLHISASFIKFSYKFKVLIDTQLLELFNKSEGLKFQHKKFYFSFYAVEIKLESSI